MRRSICTVQPSVVLAGQTGTWCFTYITSTTLPEKSVLRFDPLIFDEEGDWQLPIVSSKERKNGIFLELPSKKIIYPKVATIKSPTPSYDFVLSEEINSGEKLSFFIGSQEDGKDKAGNKAQTYIQRRRPFHLYIDPKGKGDFKDPEIFTIDVKGNKLETIRIIAPSIVFKNTRFDVYLRFEDAYGNLTSHAPEGTLIELSHEHLRENLNWKLFIPETGFLTLPNLYFNEPGIYHLKLKNLSTKEIFLSPPIMCLSEAGDQMFWGLLHGKPDRYNDPDLIESALRHFRDDKAYQFYATSPLNNEEVTSNDDWKLISNQVAEFNEEERFVSLLGFCWSGESSVEGARHIIYAKDNKPLLRFKDSKYNSLKKIYKSHTPKELLSIPLVTMAKGFSFDFENFNPEFERVVEIYSVFGSCECTQKQGNPRPISALAKKGISEVEEGSLQKALNAGFRFGFVAGGSDDRGVFQNFNLETQNRYSQGLTAILSSEYSRDAIFQALYNRRCYATTGARIIVSFNIGGKPLGSELNTKDKPGFLYNRHIDGFIAGTQKFKEITIFRNGSPWKTFKDQSENFPFAVDDDELFEDIYLKGQGENPAFAYYYIRAIQTDDHIAWGSPIWIDYYPDEKKRGRKKMLFGL